VTVVVVLISLGAVAEVLEPPSYNVAVSLPTYDESLRAKEQEEATDTDEQQQLCGHSPSPEVTVVIFSV